MNTVSAKGDLRLNFKESKEYREAFVEEHVYTTVAFQTRALREKRDWSQKRLGVNARMAQERISILEDPNSETKPTLNTLVRLAAAFDVGLEVRFVPFSRVLDASFNNDPDSLNVPSFEDELDHDTYPSADVDALKFISNEAVANSNTAPEIRPFRVHEYSGLAMEQAAKRLPERAGIAA